MALDLQNKYPGRFDPKSADYPQGKFKNRSSPTAQDGSYMERDWLNDWAGFFGALLTNASVSPNGNVDTAQSSQFYNALQTVILKSLPKRTFASSDFIRIPDVPGGLIIQWGSTNGSTNASDYKTFPVAFPTICLQGVATYSSYPLWGQGCGFQTVDGTKFIVTGYTSNGTVSSANVRWFAVGY